MAQAWRRQRSSSLPLPRKASTATCGVARHTSTRPGRGSSSSSRAETRAAPPLYSIRAVPGRDGERLLVRGEGHHVGSPKAHPQRYENVAAFATRHWDVETFEHRWSSQDYSPDDGVPYIGRVNLLSRRVHIATGFKKWGLTGGTLAGMLISDAIAGRENAWAGLFSSTRVKPLAEAPRFISENSRVGVRFFLDRLLAHGGRDIADLAPGEGGIVSSNGHKVAGHRDDAGRLLAVSTRCTHLGCQVAWNAAERSWDCPCHGSRFTPEGEILNGPATRPLERYPTQR
ncbi:MAG: FAD-dependent oxidoreductase [Nocardioidaceae bacterium]